MNEASMAFPEAEYRERLRRARGELRQAGLDGCICVAPEHVYYFCGHENYTAHNEQGMIFTTSNDEPTLIIREVDEPFAHQQSWLKDIQTYHIGAQDPVDIFAKVAKEKGVLGKALGIDLGSYALPGAYALRLMRALGQTRIEDSTSLLRRIRWIKSARELEYVREAAQYARAGLEATVTKTRPGITETQLAAEIDHAMRSLGSEPPSLPTFVGSGPRSIAAHGMPTKRELERGDIIRVEFAGVARRYHCVGIKTYFLGRASSRERNVYEAVRESLLAGVAAIRIGAPVSAAEDESKKSLEKQGLRPYAPMRFGLGLGAAFSLGWGDGLNIIREAKEVFQAGMVFYLHSWVQIEQESLGLLIGGSYLLTENGLECLDGGNYNLTEIEAE